MKTVAIIGASNNPKKFGNKAVRAYLKQGWTVYPINPKEAFIGDLRAYKSVLEAPQPLDRVSLYVPPDVGLAIINDIAQAHPKELFIKSGRRERRIDFSSKKARAGTDPGVFDQGDWGRPE